MSKQEIAALSVRILALYIVVNAIVTTGLEVMPYIQQAWFAAAQGVNNPVDFGSLPSLYGRQIASLLFPLLIAFILWKSANRLGARMVKDTKEHTRESISAIELQTIIISAIGVFVTISSIPQFILFFVALSIPSLPEANFSGLILQLINPLLSVIMGWFLLFNASRISRFLFKEK